MKKISLPGCVLQALDHYEVETYDADRGFPGSQEEFDKSGKSELVDAARPVLGKNRAVISLSPTGMKYLAHAIGNAYDIQENGGDDWLRWPGKRKVFMSTIRNAREITESLR